MLDTSRLCFPLTGTRLEYTTITISYRPTVDTRYAPYSVQYLQHLQYCTTYLDTGSTPHDEAGWLCPSNTGNDDAWP